MEYRDTRASIRWDDDNHGGIFRSGWNPLHGLRITFRNDIDASNKAAIIIEPPAPGAYLTLLMSLSCSYVLLATAVENAEAYGYFFRQNAETGKVDMTFRFKPFLGEEEVTVFRDCTYLGVAVEQSYDSEGVYEEGTVLILRSEGGEARLPTGIGALSSATQTTFRRLKRMADAVNELIFSVTSEQDNLGGLAVPLLSVEVAGSTSSRCARRLGAGAIVGAGAGAGPVLGSHSRVGASGAPGVSRAGVGYPMADADIVHGRSEEGNVIPAEVDLTSIEPGKDELQPQLSASLGSQKLVVTACGRSDSEAGANGHCDLTLPRTREISEASDDSDEYRYNGNAEDDQSPDSDAWRRSSVDSAACGVGVGVGVGVGDDNNGAGVAALRNAAPKKPSHKKAHTLGGLLLSAIMGRRNKGAIYPVDDVSSSVSTETTATTAAATAPATAPATSHELVSSVSYFRRP
jgi:hypothetical protein